VRESVSVRVRVRAAYPSDTHSEPNPIQTADIFSPEYRYSRQRCRPAFCAQLTHIQQIARREKQIVTSDNGIISELNPVDWTE